MEAEKQMEMESYRPSAENVSISGRHFVDQYGRVLDMRGANVSSCSKVPIRPCPPFHLHTQSTYIGRPFPLDEARQHWRRLRSWGLTFIRITVTWEALEHAGPGKYDREYLDYLRQILTIMHEEGVTAYVVIHQDVFSRYCGGSGAPGWVVEAAGFDLSDDGDKLALAGAAFLDGIRGGRLEGERGLWPTGYQKLACATMNTLFWGGKVFAPAFNVRDREGKIISIQDYMQSAFFSALDVLVEAVGDMPGVLGFELMNEPHPGFIGLATIHEWNYNTDLHLGQFPSPLQSFSMGAGHPTPNVPIYTRSFPFPTRHTSSVTANPSGAKVWRNDGPTKGSCPFENEGVWRWSDQKKTAIALQEDYFTKNRQGKKIDFYRDFYFPFVMKWEEVIAKRQPGKCRMVEPVPNEFCPDWEVESRPANFVYAPHWYDLNAMFKKQFGFMTVNVQGLSRGMFFLKALYFGREGAKKNYALQIKTLVDKAREKLGEVPVVIGECGIPMDLNKERAFRTGDFSWQERMMDSLLSALEGSLVSFNLWSYNPANNDEIGCDWNAEHFSWYSNERRDRVIEYNKASSEGNYKAENDLDAGARLLNVIVRPYAVATSGIPMSLFYSSQTSEFSYRFRSPASPASSTAVERDTTPPGTGEITEIFLPRRIYPKNLTKHLLSPGGRVFFDWEKERAYVWFVDPPSSAPGAVSPKNKTRRIDFWIGLRQENLWKWWHVPLFVLFWLSAIVFALWLQRYDWERERKMGLTPWAGARMFAWKWLE